MAEARDVTPPPSVTASTVDASKADASLGELPGDLSQEAMRLVRQEIDLAKTEMTEKTNKLVKDLVFLATGVAIAYLRVLFILAAIAACLG